MTEINYKKLAKAVIPLLIALISVFVISKYAASPEFHAKTIQSLDDKKVTVMELAAASTAASAAITLLPGDTATPIADKLADLSSYFLVVICAIYLEKYLVTITGYTAFTIPIPVACIAYSIYVFSKNTTLLVLAKKLAVFGLAIVLIIPASVKVSDMIEATYQSSIEETLDTAKQTTEEIENNTETAPEADKNDEGFLSGIISGVKDTVSSVTEGITTKVENVLNNFIDALAVMLITTCVIPIVVLLFFIWLVKAVLGINISLPRNTAPGLPKHEG